jgi:hypothetical protein
MDQNSLVTEQIEAGNRFLREFEKSTPVIAAFWLNEGEDGGWVLHVASDRFNDGRVGGGYGEVLRIAKEIDNPNFQLSQVRLVGLGEPLVQAVLEFYMTHPPKIPFRIHDRSFGGAGDVEAYLLRGPIGEYTMPSGREVLNQIIDREAEFFQQHGKSPSKMKLPVLVAYDLAKCGRNELGDLSGRVFKDGITVFEKEGFHGMSVEIVRDRNAKLEFE